MKQTAAALTLLTFKLREIQNQGNWPQTAERCFGFVPLISATVRSKEWHPLTAAGHSTLSLEASGGCARLSAQDREEIRLPEPAEAKPKAAMGAVGSRDEPAAGCGRTSVLRAAADAVLPHYVSPTSDVSEVPRMQMAPNIRVGPALLIC